MKIHKTTLEAVMPAASPDETRYNLNSVHMVADAEKVIVTATDGHRLHRVTESRDDGDKAEVLGECMMELDALATARKSVKGKGAALEVDVTESNANGAVTLKGDHGATFLVPKLVDAKYPNTDQVFPKDEPTASVRLNARYLRDMADAAIRVSDGARCAWVDVDLFGPLSPMRLTAEGENNGTRLEVILMPARK